MALPDDTTQPFFADLGRFGAQPALIETATGETLDYAALEQRVANRAAELGGERKLVFIQARNDIGSIVDYLAALRGRHACFLTDDLTAPKVADLIGHYGPHILIGEDRAIRHVNSAALALHPELALLMSTSGSTGSAKFVKLSLRNIQSNALAIRDYLGLESSERAFQHLKPHYSYGLSVINSHLACGAALILTDDSATEDAFWHAFSRYGATSFAGVPYTFETLKRRGFSPGDYPALRYATQAGGKLEKSLVAEFAALFARADRRLFIMYGQTEAAPRISYLPPDLAERHPGSIGKAIPGGTLYLIGEQGTAITETGQPGELAYEGPNVMMGYAAGPAELAVDETPPRLLTGDIAEIGPDGLFFIVGRSARFIKPFGLRVNLDEVQSLVRDRHGPCAVTGNDRSIVIAIEGGPDEAGAVATSELAQRFGLPAQIFSVRAYEALPLLASGKYDYQAILAGPPEQRRGLLGRMVSRVTDILGLSQKSYSSVQEMVEDLLAHGHVDPALSFSECAMDSLSYVSLSIAIDEMFQGKPPQGWETMPISALEEAHGQMKVAQIA